MEVCATSFSANRVGICPYIAGRVTGTRGTRRTQKIHAPCTATGGRSSVLFFGGIFLLETKGFASSFSAGATQATRQVFMGTHSQTNALIVPLFSEYTRTLTFETFHQVRERFRNASVAVLGSTQPWYEAMALTEGARRVVRIQHNDVSYRHLALHAYTHRAFFVSKERPETFDVILSISSFEHRIFKNKQNSDLLKQAQTEVRDAP